VNGGLPAPGKVKMEKQIIRYGSGPTAAGHAFAAVTDRGLCVLQLVAPRRVAAALAEMRLRFPRAELRTDPQATAALFRQLGEILAGSRTDLDVALDLHGTPFQQRVWRALREVPRGTTCSYTELARRLGAPRSVRAVAHACARNPVAVLVPCHRILRHDGRLGGYRWGLPRKRELLRREQRSDRVTG
jgi:AraC family transcriptional regulator of adaptative response/methylated-DNA-[protein]-cysteine methyltransferase